MIKIRLTKPRWTRISPDSLSSIRRTGGHIPIYTIRCSSMCQEPRGMDDTLSASYSNPLAYYCSDRTNDLGSRAETGEENTCMTTQWLTDLQVKHTVTLAELQKQEELLSGFQQVIYRLYARHDPVGGSGDIFLIFPQI